MENDHSPRVQLVEAIATVHEFVVHASALAGMGIKLSLPRELEPLAHEIITMLGRTPQDAECSTAVSYGGVGTENRCDTTITGGVTAVRKRKPLRDAILEVIREGEVVSIDQVVQRLSEAGFSANPGTASNELSRLARLGELDKPRRGHYRRAQAPKDEEVQPPTTNHTPTVQQAWTEDADFDSRREEPYGAGTTAEGSDT